VVSDAKRVAVQWWMGRAEAAGQKASRSLICSVGMGGARSWIASAVEEYNEVRRFDADCATISRGLATCALRIEGVVAAPSARGTPGSGVPGSGVPGWMSKMKGAQKTEQPRSRFRMRRSPYG